MKKRWNFITTLMIVFTFIFISKVDISAANTIQVTDTTKTSISIAWTINQNDRYDVGKQYVYIKKYKEGSDSYELQAELNTASSYSGSYTITGLKAGELYSIKVMYDILPKSGVNMNPSTGTILLSKAPTMPGKVTGLNKGNSLYNGNYAILYWNQQLGCDGYEVYCYDYTKRVVGHREITGSACTSYDVHTWANYTYYFKVRAYAYINGVKCYGAWSDSKYYIPQPMIESLKISKNKLSIRWSKINGVTSYTIFVSTQRGKNFKKVATVSSKKLSYTSKKFAGKKYSSKKRYYVYVRANKKVNDKTSTSDFLYYYQTR